ncbi:hypothetical protein K503DRAFT_806904 [Rhizopogon vinicolor AM-OR11-026]|uniref:Uncharacterized protein n=1 Tax=Rhizopogon vinicolor AM-OR11-026 TaxID=1314800 RepID=A0A1B7MDI9_9AGAM|nr:hypothetical protein K503DRAFT_806904 [Rhizopogon vinicolor AM-OR11-026]
MHPSRDHFAAHPFSIAAVRQVQHLDAHVVAVHSEPLRIAFGPAVVSQCEVSSPPATALEHPRRPSQDKYSAASPHISSLSHNRFWSPPFKFSCTTCFAHILAVSAPFLTIQSVLGSPSSTLSLGISHISLCTWSISQASTTLHHLCPTALQQVWLISRPLAYCSMQVRCDYEAFTQQIRGEHTPLRYPEFFRLTPHFITFVTDDASPD